MTLEETQKFKDSLTGFHTRDALFEYLHNQIIESQLRDGHFSLIILDIDHFKSINDRFGHQTGDEALKFFASVINDVLKGIHFIARYGGDEFVILMENKDQRAALEIAKNIKNHLNERFLIFKGKTLLIKASIGIATFPQDAKTAPELIKKSDEALYYAKKHGRNKIIPASRLHLAYYRIIYKLLIKVFLAVVLILIILFSSGSAYIIRKFFTKQSIYGKLIVRSYFILHKLKYKYNYCIAELSDGTKIEGWVLKEDGEKICISSKSIDSNVLEIPKNKIRIFIRQKK